MNALIVRVAPSPLDRKREKPRFREKNGGWEKLQLESYSVIIKKKGLALFDQTRDRRPVKIQHISHGIFVLRDLPKSKWKRSDGRLVSLAVIDIKALFSARSKRTVFECGRALGGRGRADFFIYCIYQVDFQTCPVSGGPLPLGSLSAEAIEII